MRVYLPLERVEASFEQQAVCASGSVDFVDCELGCAAGHVERTVDTAHRHGVAVIASFHDFKRTPALADIVARFRDAAAVGADVAKVAVMPQGPDDVLTLLAATLQGSREVELPLITMSMGPWGVPTRMFGWMFGSSVSFAAGESASAPGQLPIDDLRRVLDVLHRASGA
jgi:3-dehydroquinate dehydratase-1